MASSLTAFCVLGGMLLAAASPPPRPRAKTEPQPSEQPAVGAKAAKETRPKIAVLDVSVSGSFDKQTVSGLSYVIASEAGRYPVQVVSGTDISTLLGFERQRQLLGCNESGCLAEIGGALGVNYLLAPTVSEIGGTWLLSLSLIDVKRTATVSRVTKQADKLAELVPVSSEAVDVVLASMIPGGSPPPATSSAVRQAPESHSGRRTAGLVLDGTGVLVLAGGGILGALAHSSYNDARRYLETPTEENRASFDAAKASFQTRALLADLCYGVGAVALGLGLYLTFSDDDAAAPALSVTGAPLPEGGAVLVQGGF